MNEKFKEPWIKALRSGEYLQAREVLKGTAYKDEEEGYEDVDPEPIGTGYCCLGVLCEISGQGKWLSYGAYELTFPEPLTDEYGEEIVSQDSDAELEIETREFFGLSGHDAAVLMRMNDNDHKTFVEIADWIEEHL